MPLKEINRSTYAVEVECTDADTRHWVHPWCFDNNNGELARVPDILGSGMEANISNLFKAASEKFPDEKCMGTRPIEVCKVDGKKIFWKKGPL